MPVVISVMACAEDLNSKLQPDNLFGKVGDFALRTKNETEVASLSVGMQLRFPLLIICLRLILFLVFMCRNCAPHISMPVAMT